MEREEREKGGEKERRRWRDEEREIRGKGKRR